MHSSDRAITGRSASRWRLRFAAAALAATLATTSVQAQDLGVIGPVYPIAEPSLLDVILAKLRETRATSAFADDLRVLSTDTR